MTALDTNVLIALWDPDAGLNRTAKIHLDRAAERGGLVVSAPVYAELMAGPERDEAFLTDFFQATGIEVDWELGPDVWRAAGRAFLRFASQRRAVGPRRILADFLIGAHAALKGMTLLTLDARHFRAAFPELEVLSLS